MLTSPRNNFQEYFHCDLAMWHEDAESEGICAKNGSCDRQHMKYRGVETKQGFKCID